MARSLFGSTGLMSRWKSCVTASSSWPPMVLPVMTMAGSRAPASARGSRPARRALWCPAAAGSPPAAGRAARRRAWPARPSPRSTDSEGLDRRAPGLQQHHQAVAHRGLVLDDDEEAPLQREPERRLDVAGGSSVGRGACPRRHDEREHGAVADARAYVQRRVHEPGEPLHDRQPSPRPFALVRFQRPV